MSSVTEPITLRCGLKLSNRLTKVALAERLGDAATGNIAPQNGMRQLYSTWGEGGWGLIITGNVMVSERYLGMPEDITVNDNSLSDPAILARWEAWADAAQKHDTPAIVQLNHPGRQSALGAGKRGFWDKTISSSPTPLDFGPGIASNLMRRLLFGTPREMTHADIEETVGQFVRGAKLAKAAGFKGVELHGAHGYLIAQFLSSKINKRTDAFGGTPEKRVQFVKKIVNAIRASEGDKFCIGIKLNSTDYQHEGLDGMKILQAQIKALAKTSIDFIEVSGGTFENPEFFLPKKESTKAREAYFLPFAAAIREVSQGIPVMITGGFRTRAGMDSALVSGSCDMIGAGRLSILEPHAPKDKFLTADQKEAESAQVAIQMPSVPVFLKVLGLENMMSVRITDFYTNKMWALASNKQKQN